MVKKTAQDPINPISLLEELAKREAADECLIAVLMTVPAFKNGTAAIDFTGLLADIIQIYCASTALLFESPVSPEFERKETPGGCIKYQVYNCVWLFSETGAVRVTGPTNRHLMNKRDADGRDVDGKI